MSIFEGAVKGDKFESRDGSIWEFHSKSSPYDIICRLPKQNATKPERKIDLAVTRHPEHDG